MRQQTARAYYRRTDNSKTGPEAELPHRRRDMASCPLIGGDCLPPSRGGRHSGCGRSAWSVG
ncbi:hypothetical protein SNL152K_8549 [Streptomyces sp. NL15-2K]|nr:hypothetical protein SNL152K_8549 [Streptomyces sp. NL15-2K]